MNTELLTQLKALWQQTFDDPMDFIEDFFRTGFSPDRCRYLLEGERVCSALYWFDVQWQGKKLAYIYALATAPARRGQGYGTRLIAQTHEALAGLGYAGAILKPAEGLFPFYEKLGYRISSYVNQKTVQAGSCGGPVKVLTPAQYSKLRKLLLPENSVLQEGKLLDFLSTWTVFYAGEGCLLCTGQVGQTLYVQEYLGNPAAAPGVLRTLDVPQATLRGPGNGEPFAMYLPLDGNTEAMPGYLGLALD